MPKSGIGSGSMLSAASGALINGLDADMAQKVLSVAAASNRLPGWGQSKQLYKGGSNICVCGMRMLIFGRAQQFIETDAIFHTRFVALGL